MVQAHTLEELLIFLSCDLVVSILTNIRRNLAYDITKEELATLYQLELLQC